MDSILSTTNFLLNLCRISPEIKITPLSFPQADMLSEAVKFGHVRRIVTPEGPYYEGSVAVVFGTTADAQKCAQAMHGRFFDGRMIEVRHIFGGPAGGGAEKQSSGTGG
jgi:hypothetical protein